MLHEGQVVCTSENFESQLPHAKNAAQRALFQIFNILFELKRHGFFGSF